MAVKILDIPVYYLSKENHYNKWRNKKNNYIDRSIKSGDSKESAQHFFIHFYEYAYNWDYNKLVGFIRIMYNKLNGDIEFEIFKNSKRIIYSTENRMKFKKVLALDLHVYVGNEINNNEIINKIEEKIEYIKKYFFKKQNYLDYDDKILNYFDFISLIDDENKLRSE